VWTVGGDGVSAVETDCMEEIVLRELRGSRADCVYWLHCAHAAAQYIVIGPVCGFVVCVCLFVGLLPRQLEIACIDLHQTGSVGERSDHLQLQIKFWLSRAPGRGSICGGAKIV